MPLEIDDCIKIGTHRSGQDSGQWDYSIPFIFDKMPFRVLVEALKMIEEVKLEIEKKMDLKQPPINIKSSDLRDCYKCWIVIIDENGNPKVKHGELMTEEDDFFNVKVDEEMFKVKEIFQGIGEALEKCKEMDN